MDSAACFHTQDEVSQGPCKAGLGSAHSGEDPGSDPEDHRQDLGSLTDSRCCLLSELEVGVHELASAGVDDPYERFQKVGQCHHKANGWICY